MIVQGLGLQSCVQTKKKLRGPKGQQKVDGKLQIKERDTVELSGSGLERAELLQKIRQKIQSGFYDSDPVLEDISHGLAKAINSM